MEKLILLLLDFLKWIIENKELAFVICMSILVPGYIHHRNKGRKRKKIRRYNPENHNTTENTPTRKPQKNTNTIKRPSGEHQAIPIKESLVTLKNIRLYSTGKKGKVFTTEFHQMMNHNFGIEITLKNNTSYDQNARVGWCICKDNSEIIKGAFNKRVPAQQTILYDFFVDPSVFAQLQPGEYKSLFWLNDVRVQKKYFRVFRV